MSSGGKPKLLYLRFSRLNLPGFVRLHQQEHVKCLSQFFQVTVIDHACDYAELCDEHEPDITIFESGAYSEPKEVKNASANSNVPRIGFIHYDAPSPMRRRAISDMAKWEVNTFFGNSVVLAAYTPELAKDYLVWPNFFDPNIYRDYDLTKSIPVLFAGSQEIHYPWRNRINRVVAQHYPSLRSPHFGWFDQRAAGRLLYGEQFARLINAASVAPTCGTIANDLVRKHLEIPACNTCLITERTSTLDAAGFVDMVNCVYADEGDILDKIDWLFTNPDELARITQEGRDLVESRHTILHRDQIFQWYTLSKQMKAGQRIVQLGPFLPLTIVDDESNITHGHLSGGGLDRTLLRQGDEALLSGHYDSAEMLYRRCLNYIRACEPVLRLALVSLYRGRAREAVQILVRLIQEVSANDRSMEPDPIEWAYYIVALVCADQLTDAALRAQQFAGLGHKELDRVRAVVGLLTGSVTEASESSRVQRASVHQIPQLTNDAWFAEIQRMLSACGAEASASKLRKIAPALGRFQHPTAGPEQQRTRLPRPSQVRTSRDPNHGQSVSSPQRSNRAVRLRKRGTGALSALTWHMTRIALPVLHTLERRFGYFLPYRFSAMRATSKSGTVRELLRNEEIACALLVGASSSAWLTKVFLEGIHQNPTLSSATFINSPTTGFTALQAQLASKPSMKFRTISEGIVDLPKLEQPFGVIAVDPSELAWSCEKLPLLNAKLIIVDDINLPMGFELCHRIASDPRFILEAHDPTDERGYAIFRKAILPN